MDEILSIPEKGGAPLIETSRIHPFKDHPFKVIDDDKMHELVESILINGIQNPVLIRPIGKDDYEMISGHRRLFAAEQIGMERIPAVIKEYSDDEAVLEMVDSNLQREKILPSEKAFAYKMKYDVMRKKAGRPSKNKSSRGGKKNQADIVLAEMVGESRTKLHRYMRLTEVISPILDLVDRDILPFVTAVEISYLDPGVQKLLYAYMKENGICKSYQLYALRGYVDENGTISKNELIRVLNKSAPVDESNTFQSITLTKNQLKNYFPTFYKKTQMETILFRLLDEWKKINSQ